MNMKQILEIFTYLEKKTLDTKKYTKEQKALYEKSIYKNLT